MTEQSQQKKAGKNLAPDINRKAEDQTAESSYGDPCNVFALRRAARAASRQYAQAMRGCGLKHTQFTVLAILHRKGATSISLLAEIQGLERTSMSRTLTTMEKSGLISLSEEGWRRTREATITDVGRDKLMAALPLWREAQIQFKAQFEEQEIFKLQDMLSRISDSSKQEASLESEQIEST